MLGSDVSKRVLVLHVARQTGNVKSSQRLQRDVPFGEFCFPCTLQIG